MLSTISYKIYEMRRYLVLSLVISIIAIPIGDALVIQRDRNRSEMYGEAFWIYGFEVYNMTDQELLAKLPPEWNFTEDKNALPGYLGNITYEYPVFGMLFFAIAVWLFPGVNSLQPLWLNFLLILVFNLNLVMIAVLMGDKIYNQKWARMFFGGYFVYGLIMSAGGGKLEPLADCLLLMALILRQEGQRNKSMFTLGLAVQSKIYPGVAFPILFIEAPLSAVWFGVSMLLTILPLVFQGMSIESLIRHILNLESYSSQIVNPMYPGLVFPDSYIWPPALIPLVLYVGFMLFTTRLFLPEMRALRSSPWKDRILLFVPLYVYLLPAILFVYRWVMPWYLMWLGIVVFMLRDKTQSIAYLKVISIVGFLYTFGLLCNFPYFSTGTLNDFLSHFKTGWLTLVGVGVMLLLTLISYLIWAKEVKRRERKALVIREAEARGELVM